MAKTKISGPNPLGMAQALETIVGRLLGPNDPGWQPMLRREPSSGRILYLCGEEYRPLDDAPGITWREWDHKPGREEWEAAGVDPAGQPVVLLVEMPGGDRRPWWDMPRLARLLCEPPETPTLRPPQPVRSPGDRLAERIGRRYLRCRLENFETPTARHTDALARVRRYLETWRERIEAGQNLVLVGPCGAGKDHLLVAAARVLADKGVSVRWVWGAGLYDDVIGNRGDCRRIERYTDAELLVISDPAGAAATLAAAQADVLYRVINDRDRHQRPTWVSLNAASRADACARLGEPTVDRLRGGAHVVEMPLDSWRQPENRAPDVR